MTQTNFGFPKFKKLAKDRGEQVERANSWLDIDEGKLNCLVRRKAKSLPLDGKGNEVYTSPKSGDNLRTTASLAIATPS